MMFPSMSGVPVRPPEARTVLGLGPSADEDVVRAAYRALVKKNHPDNGGDPEDFRRIEEAYRVLAEAPRPESDRKQAREGTGRDARSRLYQDPANEELVDEIVAEAEADWAEAISSGAVAPPRTLRGTPNKLAHAFARMVAQSGVVSPFPDPGWGPAVLREAQALQAAAVLYALGDRDGAMRYEFLSYLTDESDVWSDRRELGLTVRSYRTSPGDAAAFAMARLQDGTALPYLIYHAVWTRHLWEAAWSMCAVVTESPPSPHAAPTRAQRANRESRDDSGEDLLTKAGGILVSGLLVLYMLGSRGAGALARTRRFRIDCSGLSRW